MAKKNPVTLSEWAIRNGLSVSRASRLLKAGRISAIRVGGIWLVDNDQPKPTPLRRGRKKLERKESK